MKKSFLMVTAAAVATVSLTVAGTFALFSDTQGIDTTVTSGQLCIGSVRDAFDTVPGPMFYMTAMQGWTGTEPGKYPTAEVSPNSPPGYIPPTPGGWAPGDSVLRTLTVFNGGVGCPRALEARLTRATASLHAGSYAPMADKMKIRVMAEGPGGGMVQVAEAYLSDFLTPAGVQIKYVTTNAHPIIPAYNGGPFPAVLNMQFIATFDLDADNSYQGQTMIVDFTLHAEQTANNP